MSLEDYSSQREYDKFRIKGVADNTSVEGVTVAVSPEIAGAPVDSDNPLPISSEALLDSQLISSREIKDELVELNLQMKILNKYMSKWHGDEITEEDLENDHNI